VTGVVIRSATRADAAELREIRLLALADEPDAFGSTLADSQLLPMSKWEEMAERQNYFLAFHGGTAVGMASGGTYHPFPGTRWLYGMFVRDPFRGSGVAEDLVRSVANWARAQGVTQLGLHVTTSAPWPSIASSDSWTPGLPSPCSVIITCVSKS
jgi:GNAT superfamily N-acetyltransferase